MLTDNNNVVLEYYKLHKKYLTEGYKYFTKTASE